MAQKVGSLIINLALESGAFKSGLNNAQKELRAATKRMEAAGKSVSDLGKQLSLGVTLPLVAIGKKAVDGFVAQEQAMAQVNAALKSMGGASGKTAAELAKTADALEMNSLFDADEILKQVTANLLTFGNVAGREFDRAQQAAIDMATRLGGEPQAAAIQLGKALNDPIKGITALTKVGVQFTAAQQAQIKAMVAAGDVAGAQGVILSEVEKQFSGAAQAASDTSPWHKMQVALGQAGDAIGQQLLPMIKPVSDAIVSMLQAFNNLSPEAQKSIVVFGAIAAVLGPVMTGVGALMQVMAPFTGALSLIAGEGGLLLALQSGLAGLGAVLAPIAVPLAAVAAAAALIYANWDKLAPVFAEIGAAISEALGPVATEIIATLKQAFNDLMGSELVAMIKDFVSLIGDIAVVILKAFGGAMPGIIKAIGAIFVGVIKVIVDAVKLVYAVLTGDWESAWNAAKALVLDAVTAIGKALYHLGEAAVGFMAGMYRGIKDWIGDKLNAVWDSVEKKIEKVKGWFFLLYDAVVGHSYVPDMVDGIAFHMARLDREMVEPAKKATEKVKGFFKDLDADIRGMMDELFPDARNLADFQNKLLKFDKAIANGGAGGYSVDQLRAGRSALIDGLDPALRSQVALPLADQLERFGNIDLGNTAPIDAALKAMTEAANDNADKIGVANVAISKSFKDMADATLSALDRMVGAIKGGGFLDILGSVINLGLQLGSIGLFGKSIQSSINAIPAHANGTNFAPGGLSLVGERGPELVNLPRGSQVIPNHALRGMGGGNTYHISGNLMTPEFWAKIQQGDMQAAAAGARGGEARMIYRQNRKVS